ncbi:helix-turn-helix domain-containing protein [Alteribacillus bidgolensis]|uniref:Helix-turn-helix domain-containing protein n=1 Tax=Alteribacillus bidgolensis TaxID=930129 RepID=A0A1G8N9N7_9BACI|nr:helix-turn-helix domain-containing protein [Alteribacillus bidgolensis]SDI76823.1 Helix-turn-helix domain-containing protein [Alteribacillus bidgolensis]
MAKSKFSAQEKLEVIQAYEKGNSSIKEVIEQYQIRLSAFKDWRNKYNHLGLEGLQPSKSWTTYLKETKLQAVHDYLSGKYSLAGIIIRYGISTQSVLRT